MRLRAAARWITLVACAVVPAAAVAQDVTGLDIGAADRRDRQTTVAMDVIVDTRTGDHLTPAGLAGALEGTRLLLAGESHTNAEAHRAQLAVIRELVAAGREVIIGLEMYPYTEQQRLDQWTAGMLTEPGFVALSRWYENWGYNWGYYREIFDFARAEGVRLAAVNTPRNVVTAVREKGFEGLTDEESRHVPPHVDTDNDDHLRLFRAYMGPPGGGHSPSDEALFSMFEAQCTWDATMAYNAVQVLEEHPDAIMVVLVGSGHVAYGLGIQRQAELWFDGEVATMIPVPATDDAGDPSVVQSSYADYVWGVEREEHTLFPSLSFSTRQRQPEDPIEIIIVPGASAEAAAGVALGDHLVAIDGEPVQDRETMKRLVAAKRWGDGITLGLLRDGEPMEATFFFRRR